ncbi:MAG: hypothetical protein GY756_00755 [bacterium]|nr:hypothetical protein [bacterium]
MNAVYKEITEALISKNLKDKHTISAELNFSKIFIGFKGHFEEESVLAAACALEVVKTILEQTLNIQIRLTNIKEAKFFSPIGNSENISVTVTSEKSLKNVIVSEEISIIAIFKKINEKSMTLKLNFEIK